MQSNNLGSRRQQRLCVRDRFWTTKETCVRISCSALCEWYQPAGGTALSLLSGVFKLFNRSDRETWHGARSLAVGEARGAVSPLARRRHGPCA